VASVQAAGGTSTLTVAVGRDVSGGNPTVAGKVREAVGTK
jgi:hypothetical protein